MLVVDREEGYLKLGLKYSVIWPKSDLSKELAQASPVLIILDIPFPFFRYKVVGPSKPRANYFCEVNLKKRVKKIITKTRGLNKKKRKEMKVEVH